MTTAPLGAAFEGSRARRSRTPRPCLKPAPDSARFGDEAAFDGAAGVLGLRLARRGRDVEANQRWRPPVLTLTGVPLQAHAGRYQRCDRVNLLRDPEDLGYDVVRRVGGKRYTGHTPRIENQLDALCEEGGCCD